MREREEFPHTFLTRKYELYFIKVRKYELKTRNIICVKSCVNFVYRLKNHLFKEVLRRGGIASKTACPEFESLCPCQEKSHSHKRMAFFSEICPSGK